MGVRVIFGEGRLDFKLKETKKVFRKCNQIFSNLKMLLVKVYLPFDPHYRLKLHIERAGIISVIAFFC